MNGQANILILAVVMLLVAACGGGSSSSTNTVNNDEQVAETNDTSEEDEEEVLCSENFAGNGDVIIEGPDGPEGSDYDNAFRSLTVHPNNPNIILLGTERNGFVKSIDGGNNWVRYRQGLRHDGAYPEIWDIAFDPQNAQIIYAATLDSPGPITGDYPSVIGGVYKSIDGGENWLRSNCGLDNSRVTSIKISGENSNIVIIGVEGGAATFSDLLGQYFNGGVYRSDDAGESWNKVDIHSNDIKNGYWWLYTYGDNNEHFISFASNYSEVSENLGFIKSTDGGLSWVLLDSDLKNLQISAFAMTANGQTLFANERDSYVLQISDDAGETWSVSSINQANGPVAVSPSNKDLVVYAGSSIIYRTSDGFATAPVVVLSAADTITDIVFAPPNPDIVYAIARGYLLYKSTDAGVSFSLIKNIRADVLNL